MRRLFALAVGLLHVMLAWLMISGVRPRPQVPTDTRVYASLWVVPEVPKAPPPVRTSRRSGPAGPSGPEATGVVRVDEALTEPVSKSPASTSPEPLAVTETAPTITPKIDWSMEAVVAASRAVGQADNKQSKEFTPMPAASAKPCVPRKSSMEWNGKEDRRVTFSGPLPMIKLGKRCVVTIGFIGCSLGEPSEANSHLLDDMRRSDRPASSVPDPDICD
jgi:hypothetical protein